MQDSQLWVYTELMTVYFNGEQPYCSLIIVGTLNQKVVNLYEYKL